MRKIILFVTVLTYFAISASEIDSFSTRMEILASENNSAIDVINRATNDKLAEAVENANEVSNSCDPDTLITFIVTTLSGPLTKYPIDGPVTLPKTYGYKGFIEPMIHDGHDPDNKYIIPIHNVARTESIYQEFTRTESPAIFKGLGSLIKVDDLIISSDKFGHFLSQGYGYYLKDGEAEALKRGEDLENGVLGLKTTGVFSHADLSANFLGYTFYKEIEALQSPYFICEDNAWKVNPDQPFNWMRYVNAGWDEGINCSYFRNETLTEKVNKHIEKISTEQQVDLSCPVSFAKCVRAYDFHNRYFSQQVLKSVISKKCTTIVEDDEYSDEEVTDISEVNDIDIVENIADNFEEPDDSHETVDIDHSDTIQPPYVPDDEHETDEYNKTDSDKKTAQGCSVIFI